MTAGSKWSKAFWSDLGERVGATFGGALLAMITLTGSTPVDWTDGKALWAVLGVPTATSLLKGLLANLRDGDTGASLLSAPPGPVLVDEGEHVAADRSFPDDCEVCGAGAVSMTDGWISCLNGHVYAGKDGVTGPRPPSVEDYPGA